MGASAACKCQREDSLGVVDLVDAWSGRIPSGSKKLGHLGARHGHILVEQRRAHVARRYKAARHAQMSRCVRAISSAHDAVSDHCPGQIAQVSVEGQGKQMKRMREYMRQMYHSWGLRTRLARLWHPHRTLVPRGRSHGAMREWVVDAVAVVPSSAAVKAAHPPVAPPHAALPRDQ